MKKGAGFNAAPFFFLNPNNNIMESDAFYVPLLSLPATSYGRTIFHEKQFLKRMGCF
jgi:hypothetical protein